MFFGALKKVFLTIAVICYLNGFAGNNNSSVCNNSKYLTDSLTGIKLPTIPSLPLFKTHNALAGNCYDINWATWSPFSNVNSATGNIIDADGTSISISLSANYTFDTTPSIYTFSKFNGYPAPIPNNTVPKITWAAGTGGVTTMCFSRKVTNPVLLLASLGSSLPATSRLDFSVPYVVLYDGGGMVYNSSTAISGTEGYAIIMFPGDFTCVKINSSTPENYTNLTWGIRPQPFAISFTDDAAGCNSATVTAHGGVTYKWNGGDTPNQATNTFHQSGTYLVTATNANGCVTSASKTVNTTSAFTPSITTVGDNCGSVTLTASGGDTYLWNGGSDPTSATNTFVSSGTYTVTVTNINGCIGSVSKSIVVKPASVVAINGNTTGCGSVTLTATGGATYLWDGGSTPNNATNTFTTSGDYTVISTNADGCIATKKVTVTVYPNVAAISGITTGCGSVTLTASGGVTYLWDGGSTPNSAINTFTSSGTYKVTVTNINGCTNTASVSVLVNQVPVIKPLQNVSVNNNMPVQVTPEIVGNVLSYSWSPTSGVSDPTISNPFFYPSVTTKYTLNIVSLGGCTASADLVVTNPQTAIEFPNTFTPNGDGVNDNWVIKNISGYENAEVYIFTRWGKPVFHSKGYPVPWNGFYEGKKVPAGVYYYLVIVDGISDRRSGSLTIIY